MVFKIFYTLMLVGYAGLAFLSPDIRSRLIGILLLAVNGLIFWR